jgi:predicted dehydrogenase
LIPIDGARDDERATRGTCLPRSCSDAAISAGIDGRYAEAEETVAFTLRFPSGVIAQCSSSYEAHANKDLRVHGEKGRRIMS